MKLLKILSLISAVFIFTSCGSTKNEAPSQGERGHEMQKIYVDNATCNGTITSGETLTIQVTGNLPSPAYEFERFDVKVKGSTIEITPLANYDGDKIVTQMLIPFSETCTVESLKAGKYDLKINTRGKPVVKKERITVR